MSITGQVGHMALARQTAQGTPNTTANQFAPVKITGDSLVANLNPLIAENEIGLRRDVSDAIPGGFQSAGAINGNLRARSASVLLEAAYGGKNGVQGAGANQAGSFDTFSVQDQLSWWSIEKQVGSATPTQLVVLYSDSMVNTLSISAPSAALATFSAGVITASEARIDRGSAGSGWTGATGPIVDDTAASAYPSSSDDLLAFHGGRIFLGDAASGQTTSPLTPVRDETWQSVEIAFNNNIDATEYTVRPSRFLRSLTMGIRQLDVNFTIVFDTPDKYSKFVYGNQVQNIPGYNLYYGCLQVFIGNFQLLNDALDGVGSKLPFAGASNAKVFSPATPGTNVYNPALGAGAATPPAPGNGTQFVQLNVPKVAFTGFPVALTSGRIVVTSSARALKDPGAPIVTAYVSPNNAGINY